MRELQEEVTQAETGTAVKQALSTRDCLLVLMMADSTTQRECVSMAIPNLLLAVSDISSGQWTLEAYIGVVDGTISWSAVHQSQKSNMAMAVFHSRAFTVELPCTTTQDEFDAWAAEIRADVDYLVENVKIEWDGNNHVGRWNERCSDLRECICQSAEGIARLECYDAADSITSMSDFGPTTLTAESTEAEIKAEIQRIEDHALANGFIATNVKYLVRGYVDTLIEERENNDD